MICLFSTGTIYEYLYGLKPGRGSPLRVIAVITAGLFSSRIGLIVYTSSAIVSLLALTVMMVGLCTPPGWMNTVCSSYDFSYSTVSERDPNGISTSKLRLVLSFRLNSRSNSLIRRVVNRFLVLSTSRLKSILYVRVSPFSAVTIIWLV